MAVHLKSFFLPLVRVEGRGVNVRTAEEYLDY